MSEKSKKQKKNKQKNEEISENTDTTKQKSPKKRKTKNENEANEKKSVKFSAETVDNEVEGNPSPKKKRKQQEAQELAPLTEELESEINRPENIKNVVSKRARKREKYEKLKADNKLKSETQMQQKALNYLSLWKHNKQEWKFEKIKQIWVQTHMFDSARIPDEFWDTTVQYFGGSQGKIRQILIDQCMKIVDKEEKDNEDKDEEEKDETEETKYKRARELLQHLQE